MTTDPGLDDMAPALQTTVYQIVQESLNHVRKQAGSDRVRVRIVREADRVGVVAEDFGCGSDQVSAMGEGFRLPGIRGRVRLAGGDRTRESAPGRGTQVRTWLSLPVEDVPASGP